MPYVSSFDSSRKYSPSSSNTNGSAGSYSYSGASSAATPSPARGKNSVYERPSTYQPKNAPVQAGFSSGGAKYRSSTLERAAPRAEVTSPTTGNAPYSPFGGTKLPGYQSRLSSFSSSPYDPLLMPGSSSSNGSKPASRSNSRSLLESLDATPLASVGSPTSAGSSGSRFGTFPRVTETKESAYLQKISQTLARHGKEEENGGSNGSNGSSRRRSVVFDVDDSSSAVGWRQRLEGDHPDNRASNRTAVYVTSRATSPQPDVTKQRRTRVARTTEAVEAVDKRGRPPRMADAECQTVTVPEFETIMEMKRQVKPSPSFDYFACVKQSLEEATADRRKFIYMSSPDLNKDEDDGYKFEKAPMTQLLPGSKPITYASSYAKKTPVVEESESEYEYETEEEEEDEEEEEAYEDKAENALEGQHGDYLDGANEDEENGVASPTTGRKSLRAQRKTFISGTIDIDVFLGKEAANPTALIDSLDEELAAATYTASTELNRRSVDFSNAKPAKEVLGGELGAPWWLKSKSPLQVSPSAKSINLIASLTAKQQEEDEQEDEEEEEEEEGEWEEDEEETEATNEVTETTTTGAEEVTLAEEEQWEEGGEEEEAEGEWEYYESGEEAEEDEEEEEVSELEMIRRQLKNKEAPDERAPWIKMSLCNLVPKIPRKPPPRPGEEEEEEEESRTGTGTEEFAGVGESQNSIDREKDKGYREWLEESAYLNDNPNDFFDDDEDDEDDEEGGEEVAPRTSEEQEAEQPPPSNKAQKLVDKLKVADGADVKRILFSLKAIFQTDRNIVFDFVHAHGLAVLIELGEDADAGLENLILRALGQIMLYVDGMNGVMETGTAVQFLYRLIAAPNPLVCKTAIKLLLVFVEYTDPNCLLLIQAINAVDKELGVIPWGNVLTVLGKESVELELATFALTLINKSLYGIPDQDTFYDQSDYMEELGMEKISENLSNNINSDECLLQQIQLFNVALKQEDGEPVTEEEISHLDEDATEMGLRTSLRTKSGVHSSHFSERKSLRFKAKKVSEAELDDTGDIQGVTIRDLEAILQQHGLPTSASGDQLNKLSLTNNFLEKARTAFCAKLAKGEVPGIGREEEAKLQAEEDEEEALRREGEFRWNKILENFDRPLKILDLDFSDLQEEEKAKEEEVAAPAGPGGIPPPPPPPPPPPGPNGVPMPPPPPPMPPPMPPPPPSGPGMPPPPPMPSHPTPKTPSAPKKQKKTVKLFWKEVRACPALANTETLWDNVAPVSIDTSMIEYLFEYRGKDVVVKDSKSKMLLGANREIIVLDHKRSNAINIGMTKLPPPRIIKSAVLKMDSAIMNRDGVEKLLSMLPTEEEVARIQEAHEAQPEIPLGTAEQFLITLASITGLESRLRLWSFKMEFETIEREVCEPLMDLKLGLETLRANNTFKAIMSVLLTIGNFLNGSDCKGFQIEYLAKVPEIKDTVHKHSLLYHMTYWVLETYPDSSDLYSELGPLTRTSRTDFDDLERTLCRMEAECKLAWDYLRVVSKHDGAQGGVDLEQATKSRMTEFLNDAAERIIIMNTVNKKVRQRYAAFMEWMGVTPHALASGIGGDYRVHQTCKIISEFSLEYRTTRERVLQTMAKKKAAREKKRLARIALAEKEAMAAALAAMEANGHHRGGGGDSLEEMGVELEGALAGLKPRKHRSTRRSREETEDTQLRALLGTDIDVTDNGTLRRKKRHGGGHHRKHRGERAAGAEEGAVEGEGATNGESRPREKTRRHRSSIMEGTLPITHDDLRSMAGSEIERGMLETLMGGAQDENSLQKRKERRRSVRDRKRSGAGEHELKRSRTRENNVLIEEE